MDGMMAPYFYSLGMLVTARGWSDHPNLTLMDLLADAIADEAAPPHPLLARNLPALYRANAEESDRME